MAIEQRFFKLLKYSNELARKKTYLNREDPEAFDTLFKFLVTIAINFHYSEKQQYIDLAKAFLDNQITVDNFSYSFMLIYGGISEKLEQMKRTELLELANFLNKTDRSILNDGLLEPIYNAQILLLDL
jgi:hypothetical protein